jgi:hypothetical protein
VPGGLETFPVRRFFQPSKASQAELLRIMMANTKASGYEGYAIVASNAHLQVYPQENNPYETRDALACIAA